ncbi:MAG TPA: tRNA (N(6)-L-threonylcarbamoyladenosine(37)-C(2))-methylthiotransferase [Candidatus Pacearchaeota archaeon]|jgi:MiaB-like tRNA modifying enzyme|nr:tRNA (N(6)-L-threonylcarbamoyladenosine(37)-C(2))-methylthiotransferase [Candidatus Pacearchaeota archaeon]HRR94554.1 tRNA (N(6)-L-threonylcarbamoyladenosine(37)-C(2))-methylthiotransferase [Candidatus Paceibacterota bacterium]HPC30419.1 tRNA (N(6)-L-threonylcarbamoyladenosine(37)-C(2))-methylthiotransferase [Candidatus Pacearchaeota archaeon]HQG09087.1 tRNA (N(6)-L-threonylcarbamoyladenosine(37)-C(2))-methylthiotransferase [Candidatus Pacearchaeota archaeon]HQH20070.1 tRNA (N(6)-L-threonylc
MNFCILTYGCKLNQADSIIIKTLLLESGFKESPLEEANFVIINTCGVVEKTERKILKQAIQLKKQNKKVILTGCLISIYGFNQGVDFLKNFNKVADAFLGVRDINLIVQAVEHIMSSQLFIAINGKNFNKAKIKKIEDWTPQSTSAIVAISEGCLGSCSYCATKLARGKLCSYNLPDIVKEIKSKLNKGHKEIQLTSQDLAIFGLDEKNHQQRLPELMNLISKLKGDFLVKLGMMNPNHSKNIFKDLLKELSSEKFYKFLHIPLQSGSDNVLRAMRRGYQTKDFIELAEQFKNKFPNGVLATDIIVGHPAETEKDFQKTISLIKKIKPDILHIFKFSKRKGASDYELKDMPDRIKKQRSRFLNNIFQDYNLKKNKKFLRTEHVVLTVRKDKDGYLGRTMDGRAVVFKNGQMGEFKKVKIKDCRWNYLIGE